MLLYSLNLMLARKGGGNPQEQGRAYRQGNPNALPHHFSLPNLRAPQNHHGSDKNGKNTAAAKTPIRSAPFTIYYNESGFSSEAPRQGTRRPQILATPVLLAASATATATAGDVDDLAVAVVAPTRIPLRVLVG